MRLIHTWLPVLFITLTTGCIPAKHEPETLLEDYDVYNAYLNTFKFYRNVPSSGTIIIADSTIINPNDIKPETPWWWVANHGDRCYYDKDTARCRQAHDNAWAPMFSQLKQLAYQQKQKLEPKLRVSYPTQLLPVDQIRKLDENNGESRPATYIVGLSAVVYNPLKTKALLFSSFYCGGNCGRGELIMLEKVSQRWVLIDTVRFWIA